MSSVKAREKRARRKPKVSYATLIGVGLAGPKPRAKAVGDGQRVNNPVPPAAAMSDGVTQEGRPSAGLEPRLSR